MERSIGRRSDSDVVRYIPTEGTVVQFKQRCESVRRTDRRGKARPFVSVGDRLAARTEQDDKTKGDGDSLEASDDLRLDRPSRPSS